MTTTDLWIKNLSGGRSMHQSGGLFGPASDIARTLEDFVAAGRAMLHPDHTDICDLESTMSGDVLIELLRETESRTSRLLEQDGTSTIDAVHNDHQYEVRFIEF